MTDASRALHLSQAQERLERLGWRFRVGFLSVAGKFSVDVFNVNTSSIPETFIREDRDDALAQSLQYATNQQRLGEVRGEQVAHGS
jgi:hypothetical protein